MNYFFKYFNRSIDVRYSKLCGDICYNDDCYREYYCINHEYIGKINDSIYILFVPQSTPTTIIVHSAKLRLQEFLCYIASIISLWFGFSIIVLNEIGLNIYKYVNNYFIKYCNINNVKHINIYPQNINIISNNSKIIENRKLRLTSI
jgi:hypothetical protein